MNRIQLPEQSTPQKSFSTSISPSSRQAPPSSSHSGSLFVPLHYERNYAYPLLVWLHGPQDDQSQLKHVMPHISKRNYVGIAPRGTSRMTVGYTWSQSPLDIAAADERVCDCIERAADQLNIARSRVFLAGYDAGGTMALRLGLSHPHRFAGVASIGGSFPEGFSPLARIDAARRLPLLIAHGRDSSDYTTSRLCRDLRLIHAAGFSVMVRQYPAEQELTTQMLSDLDAWIMQIVTGVDASRSEQSDCGRLEWN